MAVAYEYLSCAVNRTTHIADWIQTEHGKDVYVFGVHKGIAACAHPARLGAPPAHVWPTSFADAVHVLKGAPAAPAQGAGAGAGCAPALVLGSYGGGVEVWRTSHADDGLSLWCDVAVPHAHAASVTAIGVVRDPASRALDADVFVTGSTDGTLKVWRLTRGATLSAEVVQELPLEGRYPLDIALVHLPDDGARTTLMAVALTDKKVHVYACEDGTFALLLALEGHEDWVRALDFAVAPSVRAEGYDIHLASASQDNNVRLWRIQAAQGEASTPAAADAAPPDTFEAMARELLPSDDLGINTKKNWLAFRHRTPRWAVSLDAMLVGHDAWVTGVRWLPAEHAASQRAALLSSSADNSMIVWSPQELGTATYPLLSDEAASHALWLPVHRLGDVGTLSGGFLDALWHPTSSAVLTHDRQGTTHLWTLDAAAHRYTPCPAVSGHAGAARGIAWEPYGDYFLSTGYVPLTDLAPTAPHACTGRTPPPAATTRLSHRAPGTKSRDHRHTDTTCRQSHGSAARRL